MKDQALLFCLLFLLFGKHGGGSGFGVCVVSACLLNVFPLFRSIKLKLHLEDTMGQLHFHTESLLRESVHEIWSLCISRKPNACPIQCPSTMIDRSQSQRSIRIDKLLVDLLCTRFVFTVCGTWNSVQIGSCISRQNCSTIALESLNSFAWFTMTESSGYLL